MSVISSAFPVVLAGGGQRGPLNPYHQLVLAKIELGIGGTDNAAPNNPRLSGLVLYINPFKPQQPNTPQWGGGTVCRQCTSITLWPCSLSCGGMHSRLEAEL